MKLRGTCFLLIFLALALNAYAQQTPTVGLGTAGSFAVLAGQGVTGGDFSNTIVGDVGSSPNPAITGFSATSVTGTLYTVANATTLQAQSDLTTAYKDAAGRPCTPATHNLTGQDLGLLSLTAGTSNVYCFSSSAFLTGTLTLTGNSSDVFIFQIGSTLITGTDSKVSLNGVSPCNVFWQVGSSATIQTGNSFAGVIMALTNITLAGGTLNGRALARNAAVTITGQETIINACSGGSSSVPSIVVSPVNSSIICDAVGSSITKTAVVLLNGIPVVGAKVTFTITAGPDKGQTGFVFTDVSGIATFTFTAPFSLSPTAGDTIVASVGGTDSLPTFATCSGSATSGCPTANPTVTVVAVTKGPPREAFFSVQAPGGLFSLVADTPPTTNATVIIPAFDQGTTLALGGVTAIVINQSARAVVELTVTDLCGNTTVLDPVFATITIPASKPHYRAEKSQHHAEKFDFDHWEGARFDGIGHTEGIVLLQNDTPGVESLVITVNGSQFRTQLSDGQTKKINISSALFHGTNTVRVAVFGDPGSSVDLTISDGK
jgi:Ice-binding-like